MMYSTYIYVYVHTESSKMSTPGRVADVKGVNKQTNFFKSVYILYAFGWFL
jgi:hypothetical protein